MKVYCDAAQLYRIVVGSLKPSAALTDEVTARFVVWPWLTEVGQALQSSEVSFLTDAGRWELAARTGFLRTLLRRRAWAVVGGQKVIYRRPIPLFARVDVSMQIVGWEDEWVYLVHRFLVRNRLHALSFVRLAIRDRKHAIPFHELAGPGTAPALPTRIRALFEDDAVLLRAFDRSAPSGHPS